MRGEAWTEAEIVQFWKMKRAGLSLDEIADALGRSVGSVKNKNHELLHKHEKENTEMENENTNTTETTTEPAKDGAPDLKLILDAAALMQAAGMVPCSGSFEFNRDSGQIVLRYARAGVGGNE